MFTDPQFWVAVAFFIFVAAIFNPVRKMLTSNLDKQIKQIKVSIDEAENIKNEARITLSEIKQRQSEVQKEIELIHKDAKNKIIKIEETTEQKLNNQIQKRQVLASAKIDQLTRDANHEIQQHITSTAIEATITLLQKKLDINEKENLINVSINELNSILKN